MLSPLRNRFGIPGVISVIALVFAMFGGAYAATNHSGAGKATASAKAKKGPRGPRGDKGDTGSAGSPGASVSSEEFGVGGKEGKCVGTGGSKFTAGGASKTYACNGSPWTAGGTLPSEATETGAWSFADIGDHKSVAGFSTAFVPISFTVPLEAPLPAANVHTTGDAGFATSCPGTAENPEAVAGNLCVYVAGNEELLFGGVDKAGASSPTAGASTAGAFLRLEFEEPIVIGNGTWAVTAE